MGKNACVGPVYVTWRADVHFLVCHLSFPSGVNAGTNELSYTYSLGSSWRWQLATFRVEAFGHLHYVVPATEVSMYYLAENGKNFTLFKRFKRFKRLQTPQNTPNASSNFSNFRNYPNYFRFPIYKFILQKIFSILYLPNSTTKDIKRHSNFSNFRNYPNYFRFPIYKFILQKIFSIFISPEQHDERYKKLSPTCLLLNYHSLDYLYFFSAT